VQKKHAVLPGISGKIHGKPEPVRYVDMARYDGSIRV
jgi:hypothetical protein